MEKKRQIHKILQFPSTSFLILKLLHDSLIIHKILQFPSTSFLILKLLHDSLIINATSYISFKILVQ